MKKVILLVAIALLAFKDKCQAQIKIQTTFKTVVPKKLQECDKEGNIAGYGIVDFPETGVNFTVINIIGTTTKQYIVQAWEWKINDNLMNNLKSKAINVPNAESLVLAYTKANGILGGSNEEKYLRYNYYTDAANNPIRRCFLISESEIATYTEPIKPYWEATGGAATLPFKYRFNSGTFDQSLSISGLAGIRHTFVNHRNLSYAVLLGIGLASISIDSSNSNVQSSANLSAISLSGGLVFQYQTLQLGAFLGVDKISNNKEYQWKGQSKPWLGIGIGFSIFSNADTESKKETGGQ